MQNIQFIIYFVLFFNDLAGFVSSVNCPFHRSASILCAQGDALIWDFEQWCSCSRSRHSWPLATSVTKKMQDLLGSLHHFRFWLFALLHMIRRFRGTSWCLVGLNMALFYYCQNPELYIHFKGTVSHWTSHRVLQMTASALFQRLLGLQDALSDMGRAARVKETIHL